jgi:HAE1 family hydrophobic/amphiphilic exporter-1
VNLIRTCLERPVGVSVGVLLVVLAGILAFFAIPVQLTPNVDQPIINVTTAWPGANAQEVEREIVDRQEEFLRSVKGLRQMTSKSQDNFGAITLEFYTGVDKAEALRDVTDKLRQVPEYPQEVDEPTVVAADTARDSEIAWLILRATDGDDERLVDLYDFAKDYIKPYLDRVEGVASTDIYGGREREVQVRVDAGRLAARGITFAQVEAALRQQNRNVSAGTTPQGKRDYAVRTVGQYDDMQDILATVIAYTPGGPVYVRDVGEAVMSFKKQTAFVRSLGEFVLAFPVRREVGTNVMEVMRKLREAVVAVNRDVLEARGLNLQLDQVYDETVYIDQAIGLVRSNALFGGGLTVIVLMLFLRNWRATASLALAIPISVIGAFVAMVAMGRTLNVISLAGIAFAIGMVVDNSIVVLENIFRHREMGKSALAAAYDGTREVWAAVVASTLTTIIVFVPVILVQEEAGQLFRDISVATVASVGLSLLVSVLVLPVLARRILTLGATDTARLTDSHPAHGPAAGLARLAVAAFRALSQNRLARVALGAGATVGSFVLAALLVPSATYLPAGNRNLVFGFLVTPPGYSIEEFKRMGAAVENVLRPYWTAAPGSPEQQELDRRWIDQVRGMMAAGAIPELAAGPVGIGPQARLEYDRRRREWLTPPPLIENFFYVAFNGGCFMGATSRDPTRVKPLTRLLQTAGGGIPGTIPVFFQTQLFREGGGNNVEVQIRGDNLEHVVDAAGALFGMIMQKYGFPNPDPGNFNLGRPEVQVSTDRERAADVGMTSADVGFIVEACVDGAFVGEFRPQSGTKIDIALRVKDHEGRSTRELAQTPIFTPAGRVVTLGSVATLTDTTALEVIKRVERQRAVTLVVNPPETEPLERVQEDLLKNMVEPLRQAGVIAPDVLVSLTGNASKLGEARNVMVGSWEGLTLASLKNLISSRFFLSVLVCYLVMVALYESWVYPFVIMFSVPLAIFGGFLGLAICHWGTMLTTNQPIQQLDVLTFLGFVILVGTVVNNAILLVDQALQNFRDHGLSIYEAVAESVRTRTRPVLMTSLTTFFGQLPLAIMPGAGSELYRGLASVCAGGMIVATFGTLILVPAILITVLELRHGRETRQERGTAAVAPAPRDR